MRISALHLPFIEQLLLDTGHGKLNAHVDLRTDSGRDTLQRLIRDADIFTQGYRPGTLAQRGFSPAALAQLRPGIVCVSLSAYGEDGPWGGKRGFDTLVQGVTGITVEQGSFDKPTHLPVSVLDYASGYLMAFGAMAALGRRARDGGSYHVRVSLVQTAHWLKALGRTDGVTIKADALAPNDPVVASHLMESDTPFGRLRHLAPAIELSETPPFWARPTAPLGTHEPVWPS
jgi:crotonobetainyl-CoA:carnitine CoA-transferase CaiB-like acyl-CoA transferase